MYAKHVLFVFGFLVGTFAIHQAPGKITMKIMCCKDSDDDIAEVTLLSTIKISNYKNNKIVYSEKNQMRRPKFGGDGYEVSILFDVVNISEALIYEGNLTITKVNYNEPFEFGQHTVEYNSKKLIDQNKSPFISTTFYSTKYLKELDVQVYAECKPNFYPKFNCSIMCIKTRGAEKCDSEGKKICQNGYYLNEITQLCENDWCFNSESGCKNNGKCINEKSGISCVCRPTYTGKYCESYLDLCQLYDCPNKTYCTIKNDKVTCSSLNPKKSISDRKVDILQIISLHTLISMMGFIIIFIITIAITIWACRTPRYKKYRSMDTSIHSSHTYYPNNSMSKASKYCFHCDQENLPIHHTIYGNKAFYSLKHPASRIPYPINRAFSDLMLSNADRRLSMKSVAVNEESLPLPPPVENPEEDNYML